MAALPAVCWGSVHHVSAFHRVRNAIVAKEPVIYSEIMDNAASGVTNLHHKTPSMCSVDIGTPERARIKLYATFM
jgi:hypothetical protein